MAGRKSLRASRGSSVESLEGRTLLTVVFSPFFGEPPTTQEGDEFLGSPDVFMVFWGSFWHDNTAQVDAVVDAAAKVVTSDYPLVVNQYGADGSGMSIRDTVIDTSNPSSGHFDADDVDDTIQDLFGDGLPEPDDVSPRPIYCVVTPPGVVSDDPNAGGWNAVGTNFDLFDTDDVNEIWCSTRGNPDGTVRLDSFTTVFSHEIVEIMSDPDGDGFEVGPGPQFPFGGDDQIADFEAQAYNYRLSTGPLVQSAWSRDDQAFIVRDGTEQVVTLHPRWTNSSFDASRLEIRGDQHAFSSGDDDAVTIFTGTDGSLQIVLDGEFFRFARADVDEINLVLGHGANTVDMSGLNFGLRVTMNAIGGSIDLRGPSVPSTWNITGPNFGNLKMGNTDAGEFADVRSIIGGNSGDTFIFHDGGSIFGNVEGGGVVPGTSNRFDYSQRTDPVEVDLARGRASNVGGTFANIGRITGGSSASDTLIASDPHWGIFAHDGGAVANTGYSSFENLRGGDGDDSFEFSGAGSVSGTVDGGPGTNTLDYRALPGPVTVDFNTHTASLIGGTFANIQNVVGSQSPGDVVIGPDALWIIDSHNGGSVNGLGFSAFENLVGSDDLDTFTFMPGGSVDGNVDGGAGVNTLDYSHLTTPVTLNLAAHTATGIGGTFSGINGFVGSAGGTNVVGPDAPTTWTVTGQDTVSAFGFAFAGVSSLSGGAADDTFVIQGGGSLSGRIDGGGGANSLVYANSFGGDVVVNLRLKTATALGAGVFNMRHVTAGSGNCMLVGDDVPNRLTAGAGRAVLIGSGGGDTLTGGDGDTILIGDPTAYDGNAAALGAVFAEWKRIDASFAKRVSDLLGTGGGGLNGAYVLNKSTVFGDGATDQLIRGDGQTWDFLSKTLDVLDDKEPGDHVTQV